MKLSDVEEARKLIAQRTSDEYCFAVVLKNNGKVIGEVFGGLESSDPELGVNDTFSPCWMYEIYGLAKEDD